MERTGIMREIKQHLLEGKTAQELIAEGYKSGSVFKVQWQLRKSGQLEPKTAQSQSSLEVASEQTDAQPGHNQPESLEDKERQDDEEPWWQEELQDLQLDLGHLGTRLRDLEEKVREVNTLREQVQALDERIGHLHKAAREVMEVLNAACILVGALHFGHRKVNIQMAHGRGDFIHLFGSVPTRKAEHAETLITQLLEREAETEFLEDIL